MNLTKDSIKIKYTREGYLPNYPYHMISDEEMFKAFLDVENQTGFFYDNYPILEESLIPEYKALVAEMQRQINAALKSDDDDVEVSDWIYTYMLGQVISVNSEKADIHDLLVLLNEDNIDDEFLPEAQRACYNISKAWVNKIAFRPPTMFGEPHVIKYLRLLDSGISGKG